MSFEKAGFLISFDMVGTLVVGLLSLYLGIFIKKRSHFLDNFGIPAAVMGGSIVALLHLFMKESGIGQLHFDTLLQSPFMMVFFISIGLESSFDALKKGGKLLIIFWLLSGVMTLTQTVIGVSVAKLSGINPLYGVLAGSVSMSGGHGSAAAFGKTLEDMGLMAASSVALSSATFGLLAGGLLGAPLGLYLIRKYKLKPINAVSKSELDSKIARKEEKITQGMLLKHFCLIAIIIVIGEFLANFLKSYFDLALPAYVGAMFVAIVFNNLNIKYKFLDLNKSLIDLLGVTALSIFLSMALISLKLWELAFLALPIMLILLCQVLFMAAFTGFIVFKAMGKDYDAAVMVAGMCGSGLGATTNAMLNMGEVSQRYAYTINPYLVVTLTGAFLIDIFQMPVIITAINIFK